jgi:hypothetical protein
MLESLLISNVFPKNSGIFILEEFSDLIEIAIVDA